MTLISLAEMKRIEHHLQGSLDRLLSVQGASQAQVQPLTQCISRYVMRGGKRLRPQLCLWAFASLCDSPLTDAVLDVACAWEIFHAFLLVHDDLIDVADTRREIPSLHRQLQSLDHDRPQFGQNMAIVAGDLLFGASIRLLAEMQLDPQLQVQLIRLFSRIACTTGLGQAIDLFQAQMPVSSVCEAVLLCEYDWKTAAYTFEGPLLSGAILAGADRASQSALSSFARAIGQAYQLQNDLQDLSVPAHEGCDLMQAKRTVSLMRARANMSPDHRTRFDQQLDAIASANGHAVQLAEQLRLDLCASGAIELTRRMIAELLNAARSATDSPALPVRLSRALNGLADTLEQSYFNAAVPAAS